MVGDGNLATRAEVVKDKFGVVEKSQGGGPAERQMLIPKGFTSPVRMTATRCFAPCCAGRERL